MERGEEKELVALTHPRVGDRVYAQADRGSTKGRVGGLQIDPGNPRLAACAAETRFREVGAASPLRRCREGGLERTLANLVVAGRLVRAGVLGCQRRRP
jgi:hypothetical protein